jgi:hypothetical protein
MPDINFVDSSLKNYYEHTEISIQLSLGGFSFCIISEKDKRVRAFRSYSFRDVILLNDLLKETEEILRKDELLRLPHKKANIIYLSRKSTLIPKEYCEESYLKKILQFNHPLDELDELHQESIAECNSSLVFAIPTYVAGLFTAKFENCRFYNQAVPFLRYFLKSNSDSTRVYLQLNREFFDIAVIAGKNLLLYNTFLFVGETDLIYFILYVFKQLNLDQESTPLYYMGELAADTKTGNEIKRYITRAEQIENKSSCYESLPLSITKPYRFYSLINLAVCE